MSIHDMCFHFAECINTQAVNSYCSSGIDVKSSAENPFYYPFEIKYKK